jgi:hypothetical protein
LAFVDAAGAADEAHPTVRNTVMTAINPVRLKPSLHDCNPAAAVSPGLALTAKMTADQTYSSSRRRTIAASRRARPNLCGRQRTSAYGAPAVFKTVCGLWKSERVQGI